MKKQKVDSVLISSVSNITYITEYSGFSATERDAYLLVSMKGAFLIVSALHIEDAKKMAGNVDVVERTAKNPFKQILKNLIKNHNIRSCGFESENLTVAEYDVLSPTFTKFVPVDLSELRVLKTSEEISAIKKACDIADKAYSHILNKIELGITEKDIALELELFIRIAGYDISFKPVVAFEEGAAVPHHSASDRKLQNNNLVLLDFGAKAENYCSDMTRVFFFGKASPEKKKIYNTAVTAQTKATEYIKKRLRGGKKVISTSVDSTARDYVVEQGFPPFNHSSHGIGLEVHEKPHISGSKEPLKNGMVFSIEPGIYLPDKFGVRIEDLYAIQNNKLVSLTHSPKDLIEI